MATRIALGTVRFQFFTISEVFCVKKAMKTDSINNIAEIVFPVGYVFFNVIMKSGDILSVTERKSNIPLITAKASRTLSALKNTQYRLTRKNVITLRI